jgi:hypothetical protein
MLGLLALGLTAVMIFTLVKNALVGVQLSANDKFNGSVDLIIPITKNSEFYLEPWMSNLSLLGTQGTFVKIHVLIDGHHPALHAWQELHRKLPNVEIHSFLSRPLGRESAPWMIEQISSKIEGSVVIIGDPELVPTQYAFSSIAKLVSEKQRAYFVLPQTVKGKPLIEAIATINPTLALASIYGFRRLRRNVSHPLVSIAQGWMGMPLETFRQFDWSKVNIFSWKEALAKGWDIENKSYVLAFGEKHLLRYYPETLQLQTMALGSYWNELWTKGDRSGVGIFLIALFIWSFPIFCFFTHPFWSIASFFLLTLYRFFTKIVFQESWRAMLLHPVAALVWVGTFFWWAFTGLKNTYASKRPGA